MHGMIVAVSANGVIGTEGKLPWHYSEDLKRFKELTLGKTIIMGRNTWESLPRRPLPGRRNIVITRCRLNDVECFTSIEEALAASDGDVWFIGGAQLYEEAVDYCDVVDLTRVPDFVESDNAVYFPDIDYDQWQAGSWMVNESDPRLSHQRLTRKRES